MSNSLGTGMAGMDELLVHGISTRFRVELNRRAIAQPLGETPWSDIAFNASEQADAAAIPADGPEEVRPDRYVLVWDETDERLQRDNGELQAVPPTARSVIIDVYRYGKKVSIERRSLHRRLEGSSALRDVERFGDKISYTQREDFWDHIIAGDTSQYGLAYDGQTMFSDSHSGNDRQGQSLLQSNLNTTNLALDQAGLALAIDQLQGFRDDYGVYFNPDPILAATQSRAPLTSRNEQPSPGVQFILFVGRANQKAAHDLAKMATENPGAFAGTFRYEVINQISELPGNGALSWFVWRPGFHPIAYIVEPPEIDVSGPGSKSWNEHYRAEWFLRTHWGMAYYHWFCMFYAKHI